jgi:hypothetical protein
MAVLVQRSVLRKPVAMVAPKLLGCPDAAGAGESRERLTIDRRTAWMTAASFPLTGPRAEPATDKAFKPANIVVANLPNARS